MVVQYYVKKNGAKWWFLTLEEAIDMFPKDMVYRIIYCNGEKFSEKILDQIF